MFKRVIINLFGGRVSLGENCLVTQTSIASPSCEDATSSEITTTSQNTTALDVVTEDQENVIPIRRQPTRLAKVAKKPVEPLAVQTTPIKKRNYKRSQPHASQRPSKRNKHASPCNVHIVKSPYVKKAIPKSVKVAAWILRFGKDKGCAMCPICEFREMLQADHVCGHIVPEVKGGATIPDNLMPICNQCNLSMGTTHMYAFKKLYFPAGLNTDFWQKHMHDHRV